MYFSIKAQRFPLVLGNSPVNFHLTKGLSCDFCTSPLVSKNTTRLIIFISKISKSSFEILSSNVSNQVSKPTFDFLFFNSCVEVWTSQTSSASASWPFFRKVSKSIGRTNLVERNYRNAGGGAIVQLAIALKTSSLEVVGSIPATPTYFWLGLGTGAWQIRTRGVLVGNGGYETTR
jgi:hypothetical protein